MTLTHYQIYKPPPKIKTRITAEHLKDLARLWQTHGDADLAARFGVTADQVEYARQRHGFVRKRKGLTKVNTHRTTDKKFDLC